MAKKKSSGWLDKYQEGGPIDPRLSTVAEADATAIKQQPKLRLKTKAEIARDAEIEKARLAEEAAKRQTYISADNVSPEQRARAKKIRQEQEYINNSQLAQSLGAMSTNPGLGAIAAQTITEMNPAMSIARQVQTFKDPDNNPYGLGPNSGTFENILGTIGYLGDAFDFASMINPAIRMGASAARPALMKQAYKVGQANPQLVNLINNTIPNVKYNAINYANDLLRQVVGKTLNAPKIPNVVKEAVLNTKPGKTYQLAREGMYPTIKHALGNELNVASYKELKEAFEETSDRFKRGMTSNEFQTTSQLDKNLQDYSKAMALDLRLKFADRLRKFTDPGFAGGEPGYQTRDSLDFLNKEGYDINALTPQERVLMSAYTHGYDSNFNRRDHSLYNISQDLQDYYNQLSNQFNKSVQKNQFNNPNILDRGTYDYTVELVDASGQPIDRKLRSELQVGDIFKDEGFLSTSLPHNNLWGNQLERIIVPEGGVQSYAFPNSMRSSVFPNENEIILPKGLIRRVEEVYPNKRNRETFTTILNPYEKGGKVNKRGGWLDKYEDGGEVEGEDKEKYVDPNHIPLSKNRQLFAALKANITSIPLIDNMLNGLTSVPKGIYNLAETAAAQLYSNQTPQQKEEIFQKHRPMEYPGFGAAARSFLHDGPPRMDDKGNLAIEEEAWRKALNLPTKSNYIRESKYRPTSATDPNAKYYTFHPNVIDSQKLIDYVNSDVWDKNKKKSKSGKEYLQMSSLVPFMKQDFIDRQFFDEGQSMADYDPLQNFQVYKGYDPVKKKNYISISDRYDFNSKPVQAVIKPYDFYDRFYYEDGGKVQENYNDYSLSAPEGYVGSGYFNEGRNYSPAWGGQFKYGGKVCDSCQKAEDGEKLSVDERRKRVLAKANEIFSNKDLPYQLPDYVVNSKEAQGHAGSVCIHGVCGIMTDVGFVPHGYYTNTSFAEHAQDYGFSRSLGDIRLLKPGDIFQWKQATNYQGKPYPTHAQIFKGIDPNTGMYQFYDYYSKYHDGPGIRSYSKEEIENALKNIDTKDAYNSAQFFSLDPSAVGGIPENPFPYNLSEKEQQQHFADTHESNTKYSVEQPQYPLLDTDGYDRAQTKNKLVSYFNDKKLDEEIRKKLKITDQELQKVKPLIYGIMDQETDFGNPNAPVRNLKYDIKELLGLGSHSMGPAAVKYEALSPETKKAFNIKSPRDLSDLKNSYIGALDVLTKGAKYTDAYINRGEHIGISNKHPLARALYWYNNPSNITRSDSETRDLISDQAKDLWFNMYNPNKKSFGPFGTFETPEDIELRAFNSPLTMDRGSYPDKVIQQSKKLRKTIDFNDPSILENVEVKSIPYSMQSEPVIEGYRPLINYGGFVSDVPVDYSPPPYEEPYFAMGGSIPGSVGFTYARTGSIPSNGPYAKKTKASAQDGTVLSSEPVKKEGETTAADPVDENRMRQQERVIGNVPKDIIKQGRSSYRYDMLKNAIMQDMAKEQSIPLDQLDKKEVKKRTKELLAKREAQMATPDVEYVHGSGISKKPSVLGYYLPGRLNPLVSLSDTLNKYPIDFFENVANHEYAHAYYDGANLLTNYEKDLINQKLKETNDLYMSDPEYKKSTEDPKYAKYYDHNKYIGSQEEIAARLKALHDTLSDNITIQPKARVSSPKIENSITLGTPVDGPAFDNENEDAPRRYDPKQDKVKPEYIKKVEKDPLVKELLRVLTPEKIAELMNTIATNAPKQGAPMAKNGKKIIPIAQTGKYLPKEVSGELEPIQLDPEEEAPFMFMGKPYEELDRSREFPHLVPTLPAEELYPINININQKNLGLAEHTFTHQPGMKYDENLEGVPSDNYMLKRTVNSFPTDEDVRLNIQMPTSPKDVNFISNYKGAIGHVDQYPTSVPFEGEKHWNIDRFIIDPQFGIGIPALENDATDKTQQRRNVLADMYKYYMLQNKGDKDAAWKQANEFMSKEIDPRISGPMYDKLRGNINYSSGMGITSVVDDDYVRNFNQLKNSANIPDSERSEVEKDFLKNPISDKQAKDLAMDWLINYKKMSPKAAEAYYNKLPKKQNGGEMRFYQDGLDFKPKSISKKGKKIIKDDRGQWAHPGEITKIGSNNITMKGVPYPVLGISDLGDIQLMYPDQDYTYRGNSVIEYPMMAQGGQLTKLDQLTNFTNYNTKQPGGWLDKYK